MIIYTICNVKNLPNACILGESVKVFHPKSKFIIGLVDNKSLIPENFTCPFLTIYFEDLNIDISKNSWSFYSSEAFLLNSKPFFAKYIFEKFPENEKVLFFGNHSKIYHSLNFLSEILENQDIILVPQLIHAGKHHDEKQMLNSGIFHSDFFALKKNENSSNFLNWWSENTSKKGFIDLCKGMNADQLWLELVPTLFDRVWIEKNDGLNVGAWNLPERKIKTIDNQHFVNDKPMISYNYKEIRLTDDYKKDLKKYKNLGFEKAKPTFGIQPKRENPVIKWLERRIKRIDVFFDNF